MTIPTRRFPTTLNAVFTPDNRLILIAHFPDGEPKTRIARNPRPSSVERTLRALLGLGTMGLVFHNWHAQDDSEPAGMVEVSAMGKSFMTVVQARGDRQKGIVEACVDAAKTLVETLNRPGIDDYRSALSR